MENNDQDEEERVIRSYNDDSVSPVRFQNRTGRNVNLIWVDYEGKQGMLVELQKEQDQNFNTYVTHPWLAEDSETRERLLLNFSKVFFPLEPEIVESDFRRRRAQAKRILVTITTPELTTLKTPVYAGLASNLRLASFVILISAFVFRS